MATKAELESELAELKKQLASRPERKRRRESGQGDTPDDQPLHETGEDPLDAIPESLEDLEKLDDGQVHTLIKQISNELGDLAENKPLLNMLGAFVLGYLLGKSR